MVFHTVDIHVYMIVELDHFISLWPSHFEFRSILTTQVRWGESPKLTWQDDSNEHATLSKPFLSKYFISFHNHTNTWRNCR